MTEKPYGIIYKAVRVYDGKTYVGQTTAALEERKKGHFRDDYHGQFNRALRKYVFDWYVIDEANDQLTLDAREQHWIDTLDTMYPKGYNRKGAGSNGKHSEITKLKIAQSLTGQTRSAETREKQRRSMIGKNVGKTPNEETRKKISESVRAAFANPSEKMLESRKRAAEKLRGRPSGMLGKKQAEKTKQKLREANKGKAPWSKGKKLGNYSPERRRLTALGRRLMLLVKGSAGTTTNDAVASLAPEFQAHEVMDAIDRAVTRGSMMLDDVGKLFLKKKRE